MPLARWRWLALVVLLVTCAGCLDEPERCAFCDMVVPPDTRAVVQDGGERRVVCDPRCAITSRRQTHRDIRLQQVTDFPTQAEIPASVASYVTGSDVARDSDPAALRAWPATSVPLHWHRCLPSVLAFRTAADAAAFAREHGGRVVSLDELNLEPASARR